MPNARDFQASITQELQIVKNRVRDLIGDRHWGEEGRYKEAVLKNIIKKFLPQNISIGTGFIVDSSTGEQISRQIDIILYDNTSPTLFTEGDFIITTPRHVRGIVEVKTEISPYNFAEVVRKFDESTEVLREQFRSPGPRIFLGIFSFDFADDIHHFERIRSGLLNSRRWVNHISLGPSLFIRRWKREDGVRLTPPVATNSDFYNLYQLYDLGFSYFISNLLAIVSGGLDDRYWFSFPIEGTKEIYRTSTIRFDTRG